MNIAVFVSGNGTNLQALIDAEESGQLSGGKIVLVVSNKRDAYALERARKAGIETFILESSGFKTREEYDQKIAKRLEDKKIDLIALAGFMRILSDTFVKEYAGRIINIHPSLLPCFKGTHAIKDAFDAGVAVTGVTVHFVIKELDAGPIIMQSSVRVDPEDTLQTREERIHAMEHKLYPKAVRLFVEGKLKIENDRVIISE